ncbi:beta-lactamase/transpeptidase-like protein [Lentithecium fluviatile CBS 122367]|uniref:Beta-lactamase/transpeptidase-like protein n=1 Tax=Lentithecium fluviatile CBS 122367 TaxID=1168545 RepID=A0A6G1IU79_9PLEO|nr:beta-lactamase/transpeptidase-like protein [Lentithecium fluviatile CBS 122367]
MDSTIQQQLKALHPEIDHILQISAHFGHRNADESAPPNGDTIHWVAPLTELITAAAISKLEHDGKLHWDVPIREYLPNFRIRQDELGLKATLRDLLSNRTGIAPANSFWVFQNSEPLMKKSETTFTATYLSSAKPFGQFELTGAFLCEYIEQTLFRLLHMTRSSFELPRNCDANVAHAHCTHNDGTATRKADIAPILVEAGIGAGAGARSSMDYMTFLQALLSAYKNQDKNGIDFTPGSIFHLTRAIFTPQVGFGSPHRSSIDDAAYCMGIYCTKLPGYLCFARPNFNYTLGRKRLPPYGTRLAGTEVFHHPGTGPGHLGAIYVVPSTESAVVALAKEQPLMDPVDFVAQLALSVLLGQKPTVDFAKIAQLGRATTLENYGCFEKVIAEEKTSVPPTKPLAAYKGGYYNAIHNFVLSVTVAGDCLNVNMQRGITGFTLLPYNGDTFYWPVNREEESCNKSMWEFMYKDWHLFRFEIDLNGEMERLTWKHDPYLASPETFTKTPTSGTLARL